MKNISKIRIYAMAILISAGSLSCEEDNTLAPYAGSPELSTITVQEETFTPEVTWVGGKVSAFGINRGNKAALDSSLVWLIHTNGNNIMYPVVVGQLPPGAQDITASFGGTTVDSLAEDQNYTFWVVKEDIWNQVSSQSHKSLFQDTVSGSSVTVYGDSIGIGSAAFEKISKPINVYINILDVRRYGPLADVFVETTTLNLPRISWRIKTGSTDTLVAAIGIAKGVTYDMSAAVWEAYSERDSAGIKIYVKDNVIKSPVIVGDSLPNTRAFVVFNRENFERNMEYNIWIADKSWDRVNRQRFTPGYAYVTFRVE